MNIEEIRKEIIASGLTAFQSDKVKALIPYCWSCNYGCSDACSPGVCASGCPNGCSVSNTAGSVTP